MVLQWTGNWLAAACLVHGHPFGWIPDYAHSFVTKIVGYNFAINNIQ